MGVSVNLQLISTTQAADAAFERAVALDPNDAQAYANMAVWCHNSHRYAMLCPILLSVDFSAADFFFTVSFTEALKHWQSAKERVGGDPEMTAMIDGRIAESRYGLVSHTRDAVYKSGQVKSRRDLLQLQLILPPHLTSPGQHHTIHCVDAAAAVHAPRSRNAARPGHYAADAIGDGASSTNRGLCAIKGGEGLNK